MNMRINRGWAGMTVLALALSLHGCGGDEDTTALVKNIPVNTPAQIAQESADDYNLNENGLITAATLKRWKDDWLNERPAGITGKLVILQVSAGPSNTSATTDDDAFTVNTSYIKPNGTNVFTYLSPSSDWIQTRSNGVIETPSMVPDGASMDALLKKYNIDPKNDMIVAAMGTGSTGNAMSQGRIWYALRYWGVDKKNLAVLNGGNSWLTLGTQTFPAGLTALDFQANPSSAPNPSGNASVRDLLVDNTQLQATVGDMLRILPASDTNVLNDGVFIWDARSVSQYNGTFTPIQNNGSRGGHPWGALQLDFSNMLDSAKGYAYKTKAELQAYMDGNVNGAGFIAGDYQPVGVGNAYQPGDVVYTYCETTFRAMITGIASTVILGKPTRFYDGAMIEWNSLTPGSVITDATGNAILPEDSPWRTDVKSFYKAASSPSLVAPRYITDAYAKSSNAIIDADKAYKYGEVVPTAGTSAPPANPCGG